MTDEHPKGIPGRGQLERELAMIADVRALLRESEGADFNPPTTVPDRLLDQWNGAGDEVD